MTRSTRCYFNHNYTRQRSYISLHNVPVATCHAWAVVLNTGAEESDGKQLRRHHCEHPRVYRYRCNPRLVETNHRLCCQSAEWETSTMVRDIVCNVCNYRGKKVGTKNYLHVLI